MPSEWREVAFSEVAEIIGGGTPKTTNAAYWGGHIPWLSVVDFNNDLKRVWETEKYITQTGLDDSSTRLLWPKDIIISARGTVGAMAQIALPMAFNQSCYGIRAMPDRANADYLYYALLMEVDRLKKMSHGAVFDTITRETFTKISIKIPPIPVQRQIAAILSAFDDKIELNRRMNRTLEQMARALFKSWFVDFDPVRAKMRGEMPEGMDAEMAALFPDELVRVNGQEMPRGWQHLHFDSQLVVFGGGTPKTTNAEFWGGHIPWYSVVDVPSDGDVWVTQTEKTITDEGLKGSATRLLPVGTTIISARGTVGKLALTAVPMAMNQSCYGLFPGDGESINYTYFSTLAAVDELKQRTHGAVFDTITRDTLRSIYAVKPAPAALAAFESRSGEVMSFILSNLRESNRLAQLRDSLLPRLLSGEVGVDRWETTAV